MQDVITQPVLIVTSNVPLAPKTNSIVTNVPETELMNQNVNVLMDIITLTPFSVLNVPTNVLPVQENQSTVPNVPKEESSKVTIVSVKPDNTLMEQTKCVKIVTLPVRLVLLTENVLNVLMKADLNSPFVNVKMDTMKMVPLNVQNVKNNVLSVKRNQITVLFVPEKELTHHPVSFHLHLLNQPKSLMSQLVPLKLLFVTINVILVKKKKPIV